MESDKSLNNMVTRFHDSAREHARNEKRRQLLNSITNTISFESEDLNPLRSAIANDSLDEQLPTLKLISSRPELVEEFVPAAGQLAKLALKTTSHSTFREVMHILTNMTASDNFPSDKVSIPEIVKQGFSNERMNPVLQLIANLVQRPSPDMIKTLVQAGLLELVSFRLKANFSSAEDEMTFLMVLCGLLVNSQFLERKTTHEIVHLVESISVSNNEERVWAIVTSLGECGHDPIANHLILAGKLATLMSEILPSKMSKYIICLLRFFLKVSGTQEGCELLESAGVFEKLQGTWANRHPSVKSLILQIIISFVRVSERDLADKQVFHEAFACLRLFEAQSEYLKFDLGRLVLALLQLPAPKPREWLSPLANFGVLHSCKAMMASSNEHMVVIGLSIVLAFLELEPNYFTPCYEIGIHECANWLTRSQSLTISEQANEVMQIMRRIYENSHNE